MRDNKDQLPSVLVNELIDYIAQRFGGDAKYSGEAFAPGVQFEKFWYRGFRRFSYSKENAVQERSRRARKEPAVCDAPLQKLPMVGTRSH
jgi:exonuclease V gamma subunit